MNLEYYRRQLNEQETWLQEVLQHSEEELKRSLQETELSSYDNHPADIGSEMFERGKDIALAENVSERLQNVRMALQKMERGTYGICEHCSQPISEERLQALPSALRCKACQQAVDAREGDANRPVEEYFLFPPFGRTSFDEKDDETQFDAEDAWQEVARFNELFGVNYEEVEPDEQRGYVEPIEGFLITDISGREVGVSDNNLLAEYKELLDQADVGSILDFEAE